MLAKYYLVLVELLEVIGAHVWDTLALGFVIMGGITNNANLLLWAGDVWEPSQLLDTYLHYFKTRAYG